MKKREGEAVDGQASKSKKKVKQTTTEQQSEKPSKKPAAAAAAAAVGASHDGEEDAAQQQSVQTPDQPQVPVSLVDCGVPSVPTLPKNTQARDSARRLVVVLEGSALEPVKVRKIWHTILFFLLSFFLVFWCLFFFVVRKKKVKARVVCDVRFV